MVCHIIAGVLLVILNIVFSLMASGDKPSGASDQLGHTFFGVVMYFIAVAAGITGIIVLLMFIGFIFLPTMTPCLFLIPRIF